MDFSHLCCAVMSPARLGHCWGGEAHSRGHTFAKSCVGVGKAWPGPAVQPPSVPAFFPHPAQMWPYSLKACLVLNFWDRKPLLWV